MRAFPGPITITGLLAIAAALCVPVGAEAAEGVVNSGMPADSGSRPRVNDSPKVDPVPFTPTNDTQDPASEGPQPPAELLLQSNSQVFDARRNLFIASGDVQVTLNGGLLQADRIEFDSEFNTLFARGSVRFRRGSQYFQASTLRLSLIQGSGEMEDVYGVLDLDTAALDLNPFPTEGNADRVRPGQPSDEPERTLPVVESSGLGFPTALDIELDANTSERLSPQGMTAPSGI